MLQPIGSHPRIRIVRDDEDRPRPRQPHEDAVVGPRADVHGLSDVGRVRERNEDQFLVADLNRTMIVRQTSLSLPPWRRAVLGGQAKLLVVADGVGGHDDGDRASALAVDTLVDFVLEGIPWVPAAEGPEEQSLDLFRAALTTCDRRVRAAGQGQHPAMATTLTVALLTADVLEVAHAGDSRLYLFRDDRLVHVTRDHTVFQMLCDKGLAPTGYRHVLYNAIGAEDREVTVELHRVPVRRGDMILLCSDGLHGLVSDEEIAAQLRLGGGARACCEALVEAANQAGGEDNITVILACL